MTRYLNTVIKQNSYAIPIVDDQYVLSKTTITTDTVHILASGPSIMEEPIAQFSQSAVIFVNGSIQLCGHYQFNQPVAYVISDARFIMHNLSLFKRHYQCRCICYLTQTVFDKLSLMDADFTVEISPFLRLIYAVNQPPDSESSIGLLAKLKRKIHKYTNNQYAGYHHSSSHHIRMQPSEAGQKIPIGVSLDIRHGFVEAGTVAYIAAQLAYSLGYGKIAIHGMDLINTHLPRFYENQDDKAPCKLDKAVFNRIVPSFDFMAAQYRQHQAIVYNCSPVSRLLFKHLNYIDCSSLLQQEQMYDQK